MRFLVREPVSNSKPPFGGPFVQLRSCSLISGFSANEATTLGQSLAGIDPWLTLAFSSDSLAGYLQRNDPSLFRFAVSIDEEIVGAVCVRYPWLRGPYIEFLGIGIDFQGRGLGKEILTWVEEETKPHARNLWIAVSDFNTRAISIYEHLGFRKIGLLDGLVADNGSEILLRKHL